jgi:hypothetical protein
LCCHEKNSLILFGGIELLMVGRLFIRIYSMEIKLFIVNNCFKKNTFFVAVTNGDDDISN